MKKLSGVLVIALLLVLTVTSAFADDAGTLNPCDRQGVRDGHHSEKESGDYKYRNCNAHHEYFVDENNDGTCDLGGKGNRVRLNDEDRDAICDHYNASSSSSREGHHGRGMRGHGRNK